MRSSPVRASSLYGAFFVGTKCVNVFTLCAGRLPFLYESSYKKAAFGNQQELADISLRAGDTSVDTQPGGRRRTARWNIVLPCAPDDAPLSLQHPRGRGGGTISALKIVRKRASLVTKDRTHSPQRSAEPLAIRKVNIWV